MLVPFILVNPPNDDVLVILTLGHISLLVPIAGPKFDCEVIRPTPEIISALSYVPICHMTIINYLHIIKW